MAHAFGHDEPLLRRKIDNAIFEINQKMSIENEKELIDVIVFVPMIFALNHRQPNNRIIHFAKRLVIPRVRAGIGQFLHIDQFKRSVQNVKVSPVRKISRRFVGTHDLSFNAERCRSQINYSSPSK